MRSASGYGSGRRISAFVTLKIALFAPIPMASDSTATAVKPRDFASTRSPCRRSFHQVSISRSGRGEATGDARMFWLAD